MQRCLERLESIQKGKAEQSWAEERHRALQRALKEQSVAAGSALVKLREDAEARL